MRAAFVPIRAVIAGAAVAAVALGSGCGPTQQGTPIGMSDAAPEKARPREVQAPRATWPDFAAARAWPEASPASVALGHRRDGTLIHVRVAPDSLAAYRDLAAETAMPEGARVVAWHETPTGALLGGYLLEKRAGTWAALELDASGAPVPGDHARCVRCHDMAPTDHLFGVRSTPRAGPGVDRGGQESIAPDRR